MSEYKYDEEGFNFFYFLLSVLSLCLVPVTGHSIYSFWKSTRKASDKEICYCGTCVKERVKTQSTKPNKIKQSVTSFKFLFIVFGWIAVGLLAYQVSLAEPPKAKWDPYEILDISEGATLPEIKKVYRKLSLVYHPDKAPEDKQKEYEETFIQISKAYQVLTDDDIRKNYEQFGHPDGKQSFSMGVALPRALVEGGNSKFVLAFYALAFGLGLPFYIARWWNNSRRQTKDKILNVTMGVFVKGLKENDGFKELIKVLSSAYEFQENVGVRANEDQILKKVDLIIVDELESRFGEKYERLDESVPVYRRKARTLLYAYLLRIDLTAKASGADILLQDQQYIVQRSVHLLQGLLQIATVKQWLNVAILIMDLQQDLLQALYPGDASVKQLPHINNQLLRRYYRNKKKQINTVQQLLDLSETERKSLTNPLTDSEYLDVIEVAQRVPRLSVEKALFKVIGDKIITTGAIITFVLKLKNGKVQSVEAETKKNVKDEESEDEDEFDEQGNTRAKKEDDSDPKGRLPLAHTPYHPNEKKPYWWIFLGDPKVNRILVPPRKVTDIVDEKTIRVPFAGPPKPGTYTFSLFVKSDTYCGTDILQDIQLTIQDPADLPPEEEVDDSISEPEEDSIAGQMKLMREQGLASALAGGNTGTEASGQKKKDDDSDSDSSSDDDE
ncbi:Sec63 Brl domain-containing protein [Halteromyces radiatus]|uniref:Sec63 Brl domain-containing protein n=1 Tax=Halteromyces radiatus TaxID=101107 RepID=UPI00221FBAA6|nr:Sec63 Brl domain-containing protein [Halteromyces radiatus]KAI8086319.1 Sec63 Brl domain-containing protein [Halteromyces radiatus]